MGPRCSSRLHALLVIGLALLVGGGVDVVREAAAEPKGQLVFALDFSIAPTWFDPAETPAITTPFIFLYALHDALLKPLPGDAMTSALAESWAESPDGLTYEFTLRQGLTFHNGDPFTAEDVKFSFERYKGANAALFRERVKAVDVVGPHRVHFHLAEPWPDFLAYYGTPGTGAAWVVPKRYVELVGDEGFKRHPIGLGPYKFVGFQPGVELVVEANERYWRKVPPVKRLVFKMVPDRATRLAMVKTGEADISHVMFGPEAIETRRDPRLRLMKALPSLVIFIAFPEQWDPKSPWHDRRVRLAAVGIKGKVRLMERAAFFSAWQEKKLKGIIVGVAAMQGNAAAVLETLAVTGGFYAYGGYQDIDALFQQQAKERDRGKREALLHEIQRRIHDRVMFAPLHESATFHAVGPRVAEPAVGITPLFYFPVPYEEMRLKE